MINRCMNYMSDISITKTVRVFERFIANIIKERTREINELSALVIPSQDGKAVLPQISSIDSDRIEYFLNNVVLKIYEEYLIMGFATIKTYATVKQVTESIV
ncbi:hypothetical protein [Domibacillus mangrovi]|uniref:Uncharacterized protein n=1 Tax=Domibacillus mangrovi TaxID=1714354 RepID=A0A1Q5P3K3_9BACI|nr:hypothetical protein [Domibacillus mangrovi]OKL36824.1 hypothetical protein BLL40_08850 [Domibacillus mangrovi]